ncbi:putative ATP-dependent RNA helicase C550.03c [Trichoderma asperellum]|uniref:Putative ATP-dependent RNA helicase C550.03c n=1 Tax=Trichoderma asperellum TaxID=101201 RepID=A0A6V8QK89_TRIAP|nr:putative ATP-dependent RNA helicase C550.03c [Trichoderma asperellum]
MGGIDDLLVAQDAEDFVPSSSSKKRRLQDPEELKRRLEDELLMPSPQFSAEWLDRLQQRWDFETDYTSLFKIAPPQTRTLTRFLRHGLEGRVTGYKNVTVPISGATAKNSTSLLRKPANRADFVRGAAGFFPFAPGGLEGIEATAALEDQIHAGAAAVDDAAGENKLERVIQLGSEGGLLQTAPGMPRGIDFSIKKVDKDADAAEAIKQELAEDPEEARDANAEDDDSSPPNGASGDSLEDEEEDGDDIDDLLPVEFPSLEPHGTLAASSAKRAGREWAHMVDIKHDMPNFRELVPDMAREWPFELDTFQKEAVYHLENGDSVFVAAHTSAGKTVVAEYAIALAAKHMTKAIYTSPIKALSNQKFRDFRQEFDEVGILTGDVQINPEASCLIMTTEILRSMLYRGADLIRDVEFVIFDEVHYVNDYERGVVWEEVIIMLPEHISLILLSATVPNTHEFASWVGRTKQRDIYVISTAKRPVPLEHYLWAGKDIHKIVDSEKKFLETGWKDAHRATQKGAHKATREAEEAAVTKEAARNNEEAEVVVVVVASREDEEDHRELAITLDTWDVPEILFLKKQTLLPACIFVFSKKRCEENADALSNQDFCTATEKSAIHMVIEKSIARLKPEDRVLPQIIRLRELLSRGIAVHHGGLLPIVKELVEILFARTLVKVLFATETFAMGLNLPTRTVVFSGYRKHDGHSFRNLLPGEYTQMAGRAGRRGLDKVGSVIIVPPGGDDAPPVAELRNMILGEPSKLRSQFRLTYNMILNLLRVEALKIEEMIKRSFSEHATQQLLPEHEKDVKLAQADLAKVKREPCTVCDGVVDECHQAAQDYKRLTTELYKNLLRISIGRRMFTPQRLIIFNWEGIRTAGILLAEGMSPKGTFDDPILHVCAIKPLRERRDATDQLPFIPAFRKYLTRLPQGKKRLATKNMFVPLSDVECLTRWVLKGVVPEIFKGGSGAEDARDKIQEICANWDDRWDEMDMGKVKSLQLQEMMEKRVQLSKTMANSAAVKCPSFLKHFAMCHDEWLIKEHIAQLKQSLSDQNLQLLPDYEQRVQVLKELDFIDDATRIQLKGKVACEVHSGDELVLTELILDNVLADFEPAEIAALLSSFVFQEKTDIEPTLTGNLERGRDTIIAISEKVNDVQTRLQVIQSSEDSNDFTSRPRFGLMEVVYEWARGMSFKNITALTDVLEGTIVRTITRLDETCREVKNAARIIGDPELYQKMQTAQEMIKRDITAVASLYM